MKLRALTSPVAAGTVSVDRFEPASRSSAVRAVSAAALSSPALSWAAASAWSARPRKNRSSSVAATAACPIATASGRTEKAAISAQTVSSGPGVVPHELAASPAVHATDASSTRPVWNAALARIAMSSGLATTRSGGRASSQPRSVVSSPAS